MNTDLRFAFRQLLKSPGFTFLAVATLALGIGLNAAIFSLINDLFLRDLPFKDPGRVVHLFTKPKGGDTFDWPFSAPRFFHYRDSQQLFDGFAAETNTAYTLTGLGTPVLLQGFRTTANYFEVLGVRPILGRTFLPEEEEGADVALISEKFWRARLGGDPNVLGRSLTLDGTAHTIVGVLPNMPARWVGPNGNEVWTTKPFVIPGFSYERMMRGTAFLRVIGRMKPGQTVEQVDAGLRLLAQSYRSEHPEKFDLDVVTFFKTLPDDVAGDLRPAFGTLLAAVAFVLLIACSNVANLLLVRFSGRRREIALRLALGASRTSVLRLFVFESLLVSLFAGLAGAVLAWQLVPLVPKLASDFLPLTPGSGGGLSWPVLVFAVLLSIATGLAMGLYPAWQSSRTDLVDGLKEGGRGSSGSVKQQRFRRILVGTQVALSVTLLAGAALLITSFLRLSQQDLGFRTQNLWVGFLTLPAAAYPDGPTRARFADQFERALREVPGFAAASVSGNVPFVGGNRTLYTKPENAGTPIAERASAPAHDITPGYLKIWGVPLLAGRDFDERDLADRPQVMLISQAGARKVFGNESPLGKTLLVTSSGVPAEIVGIVGDIRSERPAQQNDMEFYRPLAQENFPFFTLTVSSTFPANEITRLAEKALGSIDSTLAIAQPQMMNAVVAQAMGEARLTTILLGVFAAVALLLATVGIYGAVAYSVEQRTGEIGVRMALGAQTRDVLRLVVGQGMKPVLLGLVAGLAAALALGRLIAAQLYQVSAQDPILLSGTVLLLALAALLACLFPARRATLVNPVEALRAE